MKVAQVIGSFGGGGAERLAYNLAVGLRDLGVDSTCIAIRNVGDYATSHNQGVQVTDLAAGRGGIWTILSTMMRLRRVVRQQGLEALHIHGQTVLPFCMLAFFGLRVRPKIFFTWHNSTEVLGECGWRRRLMLWALGRCERVFGPSRQVVEKLSAVSQLKGCVEIFRNGVPAGPLPVQKQGNADEPVILWMARMVPDKDPQILVRVAAQLRAERLRFRVVLAGNAPPHLNWFFEQTRALVKELGLEDVVSMPGWVAQTEELVMQSSIGVQTSHSEGLSMTLLEQMMAGLALVGTDVGDTAVAIEHGRTGLLIPPRNGRVLCDALRQLITDVDLRRRLGAAARERALRQFSLSAMAQQAIEYYGAESGA